MPTLTNLTQEEKQAIKARIPMFKAYMSAQQFQADQVDRKARVAFFQQELPERLSDLSEADMEAVVGQLWANRMWGNKSYHAQKIIAENGMVKLRDQLSKLIHETDPEAAYASFLESVKGFGPASTTEILTYLRPDSCGIWNRQAREGLRLLGLGSKVKLAKYQLTADEYRSFNLLLGTIAAELKSASIPDVDLLLVDFLLFEVAQNGQTVAAVSDQPDKPATTNPPVGFDHDELRDLLKQIGTSLGFDASTEVKVAHGAKVDAVWRARIANLGLVQYVFEVHKSGSIDSLILNLQKARSAPSVQRVIAVSDDSQLQRIKHECEGLPEEFRKVMRFWKASEVIETGEYLQKVMGAIENLQLVDDKVG
jgi:hypothetical protein